MLWPFGSDQGVYYAVARAWVLDGAPPYRGAFDHKTPGIFVVHAVLLALFGEQVWPIRLAEWLLTIPLGAILAGIARRAPPPWLVGFAVLAVNVLYFGFFDFWNTAQCELWCAFAIVVAIGCGGAARATILRAAVAGVAVGTALVFKPPALGLGAVAFVLVVADRPADRSPLFRGVVFAAAALIPPSASILWLGQVGALDDAVDLVVHANRWYTAREGAVDGPLDVLWGALRAHHDFDPFATLLHIALVALAGAPRWVPIPPARRRRYRLALALVVAGGLGVLAQLKCYRYHWILVLPGEALTLVLLANDLAAWMRSTTRARAFAVLGVAGAYVLTGQQFLRWTDEWWNSVVYAAGERERATFLARFAVPSQDYRADEEAAVGAWLRAHAAPGDRLLVRGYHPTIYVTSGLRFAGRFFWDLSLTAPTRDYKRTEWLEEDRSDVERFRPRWVVALAAPIAPLQSTGWFVDRDYGIATTTGSFVILRRGD